MDENVEADLLIELRDLAGVEPSLSKFPMTSDGVRFEVEYSGGSSSSLTLRAHYDSVAQPIAATQGREANYRSSARATTELVGIRPMLIKLRLEDADDRNAKSEGINREHQTGDATFDDEVYVDSPTIDAALLQRVLSKDVRVATSELLRLAFESITIDDNTGYVTAYLTAFLKLRGVSDRAPRVARAFAQLLSGLPKVTHSGDSHPERSALPTVVAVFGGIAAVASMPGFIVVADKYNCTEPSGDGEGVSLKTGCGGVGPLSLIVAVIVGFAVATITRVLVTPGLAGHSDSRKRIRTAMLASFLWVAVVTFFIAIVIGFSTLKK